MLFGNEFVWITNKKKSGNKLEMKEQNRLDNKPYKQHEMGLVHIS
jgi:hypothetical protein